MTARVSPGELATVAAFVEEVSGVVIDGTKDYLVEGRLGPVCAQLGARSFAELVDRARADRSGRIRRLIVDAIVTRETSFFRDQWPFDLLAHKLAPEVLERQMGSRRPHASACRADPSTSPRPRLDLWSAAAATGQEVYSLAIVLRELLGGSDRYTIRLLGTDISEDGLTLASRGVYSAAECARGLTERRLQRFFTPEGPGWRVCDELRAMVSFQPLNLLDRAGPATTFDVVFCRNVAIYFSAANRRRLFDRIATQLRPRGALVVGATESLQGVTDRFALEEFNGSVFYRKIS